MFTGLVREIGRLEAVRRRQAVAVLQLSAPHTAGSLAVGDSLAVNGICLTVTGIAGPRVEVEATAETRRVTTLPRWNAGDALHLEPSLRVGDPLGGHFVLGHVDGIGRVVSIERRGGAAVMRVSLPRLLSAELVPKGSIAVDGVSLTLDEGPFRGSFSVTLVPHTLAATRFGSMSPGDAVNLELDVLVKAARGRAARPGPADRLASGAGSGKPASGALTLASILDRGWQGRHMG